MTYLPSGVVRADDARIRLEELLVAAPVAHELGRCHCPPEPEQTQEYQDGDCQNQKKSEQDGCQDQTEHRHRDDTQDLEQSTQQGQGQ